MAKQVIGVGTTPNDNTGDDIRDAFIKVNDNFDETYTVQVTGLVLYAVGWSLVSSLYEYDLAYSGITSNSIVDVIPSNADIATVQAAEILPYTQSSSASVKIFATNAPTGDIHITLNIVELGSSVAMTTTTTA